MCPHDGAVTPADALLAFRHFLGLGTLDACQQDRANVTNPAGDAVQLTYYSGTATGLLATLTDARGNVHRYTYDALRRLIRDENPAGGVTTLARTDLTDAHYTITLTTASGAGRPSSTSSTPATRWRGSPPGPRPLMG